MKLFAKRLYDFNCFCKKALHLKMFDSVLNKPLRSPPKDLTHDGRSYYIETSPLILIFVCIYHFAKKRK